MGRMNPVHQRRAVSLLMADIQTYINSRPAASETTCEAASLLLLPGLRLEGRGSAATERIERGGQRKERGGQRIERGGIQEILMLQQKMVLQLLDRCMGSTYTLQYTLHSYISNAKCNFFFFFQLLLIN